MGGKQTFPSATVMPSLMANGGWHGTDEEWQRLEAPLLTIDAVLERFATRHGLAFSKNSKAWPERSLRWGDNPGFLIQLYLESEADLTWNVWLCCSEDRADGRYWRKDFPVRDEPLEVFRDQLPALLEDSFGHLIAWGHNVDELEFAGKLTVL